MGGEGGGKARQMHFISHLVICNLISFQFGPGELGMNRNYYIRNTSDDQIVSQNKTRQFELFSDHLSFLVNVKSKASFQLSINASRLSYNEGSFYRFTLHTFPYALLMV